MNDAHAREVAAIEAMVGEYCGREPARYGRSPAQVWLDEATKMIWPAALQSMRDLVTFGQVMWLSTPVHENDWVAEYGTWEPPLPRAMGPQRVMGRPRKAAVKPGRKFSGMTRFPWRQR